jgi:hypothetical protein
LLYSYLAKSKAKASHDNRSPHRPRLDALRRNRASEEQLGQLIQEELDRTPAGERDKLLGYFERWLDRQCLILLEEWSPKSRMVQ